MELTEVFMLSWQMASPGNWMHLQYQSRLQARKALSKDGKVFGDAIMVGVKPCIDKVSLDPHPGIVYQCVFTIYVTGDIKAVSGPCLSECDGHQCGCLFSSPHTLCCPPFHTSISHQTT